MFSYFPWLCVWGSCIIIFCQFLHIDPGKTEFLFPLLLFSLWCAKSWAHYGKLVVFVCFHMTLCHYYNHIDLSEGFEHINYLSIISCKSQPFLFCLLRLCEYLYFILQIVNINHYVRLVGKNNVVRCLCCYVLITWINVDPGSTTPYGVTRGQWIIFL